MIVLKLSRTLVRRMTVYIYQRMYCPAAVLSTTQRTLAEVEKCICDLLEEFGDVSIICNGDFNARTANYQVNQDFVQNYENDVAYKRDVGVQSNLARQLINDFGKRLLELYALFDLRLISSCRPWDNHGKFTIISDQGCSVVDYFLMSRGLLDFVHTFFAEDRIGSDHMPVELYCNFYTD